MCDLPLTWSESYFLKERERMSGKFFPIKDLRARVLQTLQAVIRTL